MTDVLSAYRNQHPALMKVTELPESTPDRLSAVLRLNEYELSLLKHPEDYRPQHPAQYAALCGHGTEQLTLRVHSSRDVRDSFSENYALALYLGDPDEGDQNQAQGLCVAVELGDLSLAMIHVLRGGPGFMGYLNPKALGHVVNLKSLAGELVDRDEWAIVLCMAADLLASTVKDALEVAHDEALLDLGERFPSVRYGANTLWFDEYDELVADLGVRVTMVEEPLFTDHPEDDAPAGGEL